MSVYRDSSAIARAWIPRIQVKPDTVVYNWDHSAPETLGRDRKSPVSSLSSQPGVPSSKQETASNKVKGKN